MLKTKKSNFYKIISFLIKLIIILLIFLNIFAVKAFSNWRLSYASIDAKIYVPEKLNNKTNQGGILSFDVLIEYFKPVKKYYYSTVYKIKVNCFEKKISFLEKTFYSEKLFERNNENKNKVKEMKLLDNKKKNIWYKFKDTTWWTLVSEDACEKKFNSTPNILDNGLYKIRSRKLSNEISNEDMAKIKNYFGEQLFKKILIIREKNWKFFKERLIRDLNSKKF